MPARLRKSGLSHFARQQFIESLLVDLSSVAHAHHYLIGRSAGATTPNHGAHPNPLPLVRVRSDLDSAPSSLADIPSEIAWPAEQVPKRFSFGLLAEFDAPSQSATSHTT